MTVVAVRRLTRRHMSHVQQGNRPMRKNLSFRVRQIVLDAFWRFPRNGSLTVWAAPGVVEMTMRRTYTLGMDSRFVRRYATSFTFPDPEHASAWPLPVRSRSHALPCGNQLWTPTLFWMGLVMKAVTCREGRKRKLVAEVILSSLEYDAVVDVSVRVEGRYPWEHAPLSGGGSIIVIFFKS